MYTLQSVGDAHILTSIWCKSPSRCAANCIKLCSFCSFYKEMLCDQILTKIAVLHLWSPITLWGNNLPWRLSRYSWEELPPPPSTLVWVSREIHFRPMEEKLQRKCRSDHAGIDPMPRQTLVSLFKWPRPPLIPKGGEPEPLRMCGTKGHC